MAKDYIGYQQLADNAMRTIVREALRFVEKKGLIGGHHFFVSFKTHFPGVDIPDFLKEQYPVDITIVLENQFWGLKVEDDYFEVALNFRKIPATLHVPYAALTAFVDKGANFGLQFQSDTATDAQAPQAVGTPAKIETLQQPAEKPAAPEDSTPKEPGAVVSLDKFRKK